MANVKERMMPIESDVEEFRKRDNATAVLTVGNDYEVWKISFETSGNLLNKWIKDKRVRNKVCSAPGTLTLDYLKE